MSGSGTISRRFFAGGALLLGLGGKAFGQGFCGLGETTNGFAPVVPGKAFAFPADHGPHPGFRIEWWYVTANLVDASGVAYGAQWTLFRQAIAAGAELERWANQQIWLGPAAVSARPASRQARSAPGSIPGKCAGSLRSTRRISRHSRSTRRAPISATRC